MGLVYEAIQENPRRTVALKVLRSGRQSPAHVRRFEYEAEILGRLQHPHIAQVYEGGTFDEGEGPQPFFAMEFVHGRSLTRYAEEEGLSASRRLELLAVVCDAVHYAHQQGIIHRDVKPDNVLVDAQGSPKVLDFGIARVEDEELRRKTMQTEAGGVFGTFAYMSPEHLSGDPDAVTICSDVYSLGVIAYELLAGQPPYEVEGMSFTQIIDIICRRPTTKLGTLEKRWKGDVETIVAKAMEKEPERRYQSAAELAADLRRFLESRPIHARPPGRIYQTVRFARRHKALVGAAGLVVLALTAGFIVSTLLYFQTSEANAAAELARQEALSEAEKAKAINRYVLTDMLEAANPWKMGREVKVIDVLERSVPKIDEAFAEQPEVAAAVRHSLGSCYASLGLSEEAVVLLREALSVRVELLGPAHLDVLETKRRLAELLFIAHEWEECIRLITDVHEGWREAFGEDDPRTLDVLADVGVCTFGGGEVDTGIEIVEGVLEICLEQLGESADETIDSMRKLGTLYLARDRYAEALELMEHHVSLIREREEANSPELIGPLTNLAQALAGEGRYERAIELAREARALALELLGPDHRDTVLAASTLSRLIGKVGGSDEEREALEREVVAGYEQAFGPTHANTLTVKNNMAGFLRSMRRLDEAEELCRETLELAREHVGERSENVGLGLNSLGAILLRKNEFEEADEVLLEALEVMGEIFGERSVRTADIQYNRARLFEEKGDLVKAEEAFRDLIIIESELYGDDHPHVATDIFQLGLLLEQRGDHPAAIAALRESLTIRRDVLPADHQEIFNNEIGLGRNLLRLDQYEEAEELLLSGYRGLTEADAQRSLESTGVAQTLAGLYEETGRAALARPYRQGHEATADAEH